ncbi:capsular biosynthesis protein, partial [Staphylococcus aureus]|nr:capsular biosynthesis protein [Staphylococcus aureus]
MARKELKRNKLEKTLYVHDKPKSIVSEKFRGIRSNIMFSGANGEIKSVVITSEKPAA